MDIMKYCVASIEDGIAALEAQDRTVIHVPVYALPEGIREGDWLSADDSGSFIVDPDETERRRRYNRSLFESLLEP